MCSIWGRLRYREVGLRLQNGVSPPQNAWWRHAKRGFMMLLLLPTATSMVFLTYWKYVGYENGVAEVAVFFAKKFFIQHSKDIRGVKRDDL